MTLSSQPYYLITLSAADEESLRRTAGEWAKILAAQRERPLSEIVAIVNETNRRENVRLALVAESAAAAPENLDAFAGGGTPPGVHWGEAGEPAIVFMFTGQGAQYPGMGRRLYQTSPIFRTALEECHDLLQSHLERPLLDVLFAEDEETAALVDQTVYTQPALFSIEYALARWWQSRGIQPAVVMGHSVGEYVAAALAGVFSLADGIKLIAERGRQMQALPEGGTMAAVFTGERQVQAAISAYADRVAIAAINGPTNTVISGEKTAVQQIMADLKADGVRSRELVVSHAFHSPLMAPMLDGFEAVARTLDYREPQITFISNVTGREATGEVARPSYWREHVRDTVRFADAVETLYEQGYHYFLEPGPQPVLIGMGKRILPRGTGVWLPSLKQGDDDWRLLLDSLGALYVAGYPVVLNDCG